MPRRACLSSLICQDHESRPLRVERHLPKMTRLGHSTNPEGNPLYLAYLKIMIVVVVAMVSVMVGVGVGG